jgi:hypothetical protein
MSVQTWVRLLLPAFLALAVSKTGWIYAIMFQLDRPISAFQKTVIRWVSWFVLGMGYIVLWQYELDAAFHLHSVWRLLLVLWATAMAWLAIRALRRDSAAAQESGGVVSTTSVKDSETNRGEMRKP